MMHIFSALSHNAATIIAELLSLISWFHLFYTSLDPYPLSLSAVFTVYNQHSAWFLSLIYEF